jgi:hypothetical protein
VNTKQTDIIMFNSRNLGALIVDEKPHVKSWDEPQYSIQNLGIEESYGFGVLNEGQAIAVAKNVKVRQNAMSTPEALDHRDWSIENTEVQSRLGAGRRERLRHQLGSVRAGHCRVRQLLTT